jgi:hypothetical protein
MLAVFLAVSLAPSPRVLPVRGTPALAQYDLLMASPGKLPSWQLPAIPQLAAYKAAVLQEPVQEAPAMEAAAALLAEMGENTERLTVTSSWGEVFDGLKIKADKGGGSFNKMSYRVKKILDADIVLQPRRAQMMGGASFNSAQRLISTPGLESEEFYPGLLHEARHAWYSKEERAGRIRLFHGRAVARQGRILAPGALSYRDHLSFEELSTFPKTLRHIASLKNKRLALKRYWYMLDIMRTSAILIEEAQQRLGQTQNVGDGLALGLYDAEIYVPHTSRPEEDMAKRWELLYGMIVDSIEPLKAYMLAVEVEDWKQASAMAGKMVARVRQAEDDWLRR